MGMRVVVATAIVAALTAGCGAAAKAPEAIAPTAPATAEAAAHLETPAEAGCTEDGVAYPLAPSTGDSEQAALDAMVVESYPDGTSTYEVHRLVGGDERADTGYGFLLLRDGRAVATGGVGREGDTWSAQLQGSCAERDVNIDATMPSPNDAPWSTLRLTCTPDGVEVDSPRVHTTPGGVQVVVTDRTGFAEPFLTYGKDGRHHGGSRLSTAGLSPLDIAPGTWQIGGSACTPKATGSAPATSM